MTKFWIAIASVVFCLLIAAITTIVVLEKQTINIDFEFANISYAKTYNGSTVGENVDSLNYLNIRNKLNESMKIKKLNTIGKNLKINKSVKLLKDTTFSNSTLLNNKCIELVFKNQQTKIVNYNSNTKKIVYTKLLIVLCGSNDVCEHVVFYANGNETFENEPMQFAFSEKVLSDLFN